MYPFSLILPSLILLFCFCGDCSCMFSGHYGKYVSKSFTVARCRASCLEVNRLTSGDICLSGSRVNFECEMCWGYCDMLLQEREMQEQMCADERMCLDGCHQACHIYRTQSPLPKVKRENVKIFNIIYTGNGISWFNKHHIKNSAVFIVFYLTDYGKWREFKQTTDTFVPYPEEYVYMQKIAIVAVNSSTIVGYGKKNYFYIPITFYL